MPTLVPAMASVENPRTLPLRVAPIAGEALDSWLEAIASRHATTFGEVMTCCGMSPTQRTNRWITALTGEELRRISVACGTDPQAIHNMTLRRYQVSPGGVAPAASRRGQTSWTRPVGSRYCPRCLGDGGGRWQLAWRLSWTFACLRHRCLLADTCPRCSADQRRKPPASNRIPQPGRCCTLRDRDGPRERWLCDADLSATDVLSLSEAHPVLEAQQSVNALLRGERPQLRLYGSSMPSSDRVLTDLVHVGRWIASSVDQVQLDHHLTVDVSAAVARHRAATAWPHGRYWNTASMTPSALDTATGIVVVLHLLAMPTLPAAASALQRLMTDAHTPGAYRRPFPESAHLTPPLRCAYEAAYEKHNADAKVRGRFARASASPRFPRTGSLGSVR